MSFIYPDPTVFNYRGQRITYEGSGFDADHPVIISGAVSTDAGVEAEQEWLNRFFPKYDIGVRAILTPVSGSSVFELVKLTSPEGVEKSIYFDVTQYHGAPSLTGIDQRCYDNFRQVSKGRGGGWVISIDRTNGSCAVREIRSENEPEKEQKIENSQNVRESKIIRDYRRHMMIHFIDLGHPLPARATTESSEGRH